MAKRFKVTKGIETVKRPDSLLLKILTTEGPIELEFPKDVADELAAHVVAQKPANG
jgi:hypothetical protein